MRVETSCEDQHYQVAVRTFCVHDLQQVLWQTLELVHDENMQTLQQLFMLDVHVRQEPRPGVRPPQVVHHRLPQQPNHLAQ